MDKKGEIAYSISCIHIECIELGKDKADLEKVMKIFSNKLGELIIYCPLNKQELNELCPYRNCFYYGGKKYSKIIKKIEVKPQQFHINSSNLNYVPINLKLMPEK